MAFTEAGEENKKKPPLSVLAIVATARKKGLVSSLAQKVLEGANEAGHTTEFVNLYHYKIDYCRGCWMCETKGKCVLKDDFNILFEKVKNADVLVLAAPTYWSNVPGIMNPFFDRQYGLAMHHGEGKVLFGKRLPLGFGPRKEMRGKKVILITACTTPFPFNFLMDESRGAIRAVKNYTRKIKAKVIAKVIFTDSRFLNYKGKREKLENKCIEIGKKFRR